jgi:hypothetical protein
MSNQVGIRSETRGKGARICVTYCCAATEISGSHGAGEVKAEFDCLYL